MPTPVDEHGHGDLVTTRLAARTLGRTGRPRGLTFDDHLVRGALVVDLALLGALRLADEVVEIDHARAAEHDLADLAALVDRGDDSLLDWVDAGAWTWLTWADHLVARGVWTARPRRPWRPGRAWRPAAGAGDDPTPSVTAATATQELARVAGLSRTRQAPASGYGVVDPPDPALLARLGDQRWVVELVAERLLELRRSMRGWGHAVD